MVTEPICASQRLQIFCHDVFDLFDLLNDIKIFQFNANYIAHLTARITRHVTSFDWTAFEILVNP